LRTNKDLGFSPWVFRLAQQEWAGAEVQFSLTLYGPTKSRALIQNMSFSAACKALLRPTKKDVPQGLKADVFSIVYGPTKVVP
jgi:hypothetical protein